MKLFDYVKTAFVQPWNLLAFLGGIGFAALSGYPDVAIPLVLAGEVGYLGLIATHPKFQKYVEAQKHKESRQEESRSAERALRRILSSLPSDAVRRFEELRKLCGKLWQIAADLRRVGNADTSGSLEKMQLAGLDRLMWVYLRLLFTEHSLEKFLRTTHDKAIQSDIQRLEQRLEQLGPTDNPRKERLHHTLNDNLQTSRDRLSNYRKAQENYEFVLLELERLENKIRSLGELAINRHEPDFISSRVDEVAGSMLETEKTINDLQFITGLDSQDEQVPEILRTEVVAAD